MTCWTEYEPISRMWDECGQDEHREVKYYEFTCEGCSRFYSSIQQTKFVHYTKDCTTDCIPMLYTPTQKQGRFITLCKDCFHSKFYVIRSKSVNSCDYQFVRRKFVAKR